MIHASPSELTRPTIAIVTVCLNDLRGLQCTSDSLRSQTQEPCQWIVVDGGSEDGTPGWLEEIHWSPLEWSSEHDGGIYAGMNRGLRRVRADYVVFLNSGDTLASDSVLESVTGALSTSVERPSLLYGDCFELDSDGASHFRRARAPAWVPIGMPTSHQAMYFYTKSILDGYDTRYRLSGDYAVIAKLYSAHRGSDFRYLPQVLCRAQLGGRSEQRRSEGMREDREIRRLVLGMSRPASCLLHSLHGAHAWIKRHAPALHRVVRYS